MNLLLIALVGAGIYAYNRNENFKTKADEAGKAISELGKEAYKEIKNTIKKEGK